MAAVVIASGDAAHAPGSPVSRSSTRGGVRLTSAATNNSVPVFRKLFFGSIVKWSPCPFVDVKAWVRFSPRCFFCFLFFNFSLYYKYVISAPPFFGASFSTSSANMIPPLLHGHCVPCVTCACVYGVCRVSRVCMQRVTLGVLLNLFLLGVLGFVRDRPSLPWAPQQLNIDKHRTDCPSILYLEYRVFFLLRVLRVLKYWCLNTRSTWSMSSTEGPNTPSTGSMSSTYTRVQAVLGVKTSKLLGVLRVSRVLDTEILRVHKVPEVFFSRKYSNYTPR